MKDDLLRVKNLSVGIEKSGISIVDDVSFRIGKKEIVGIVGESGCGKSMTSLSVMGLLPPGLKIQSGTIEFAGQDLAGASEKELIQLRGRDISMIFQEPMRALHPLIRVGKQVEEVLKNHTSIGKKERKERVLEAFREAGIPDPERYYKAYPHELSGGLNQRVMIAMSLVMTPSLLIADEPTTALDVTTQEQILSLLVSLCEEKELSLLIISHDLAVICENCHYIYVMYAGEIVEATPVREFLKHPRHPYTKALFHACPDAGRDVSYLEPVPGMVPLPGKAGTGCRFCNRCREKMEICEKLHPDLCQVSEDVRVRCHKFREGGEMEWK